MNKRGVHEAPRRRGRRRESPSMDGDLARDVERRELGSIGGNEEAGECSK